MNVRAAVLSLTLIGLLTAPHLTHAAPSSLPKPTDPGLKKPAMELKGQWRGTFRQTGLGTFPMDMTIARASAGAISGVLHWPTIMNSRTAFVGKVRGRDLTWTETRLLQGGRVVLHGKYVGHLDDKDDLSGNWTRPGGAEPEGTFLLSRSPKRPVPARH